MEPAGFSVLFRNYAGGTGAPSRTPPEKQYRETDFPWDRVGYTEEKAQRVKKKCCLLPIINFFSSGAGCRGKRRAVERGRSRRLRITQLGEFNDLFDRDKAVPIQ